MNYAIWKLNFTNPDYGTGPEATIGELGFEAVGAFSVGSIETGSFIVGYVNSIIETNQLSSWEFSYIDQEQALSLARQMSEDASLAEDGRISFPIQSVI